MALESMATSNDCMADLHEPSRQGVGYDIALSNSVRMTMIVRTVIQSNVAWVLTIPMIWVTHCDERQTCSDD